MYMACLTTGSFAQGGAVVAVPVWLQSNTPGVGGGASDRSKLQGVIGIGAIESGANNIDALTKGITNNLNGVNSNVGGLAAPSSIDSATHARLVNQYKYLCIQNVASTATGALGGVTSSVDSFFNSLNKNINDTIKPVSSFMGYTIAGATGILRDPVGSIFELPNTIGNMLDRRDPTMRARYVATMQKFHIDKLAELPSNLFGSLKHLASAVDGLLAVPFGILNDLYMGAMDIIKKINQLVQDIFTQIQKLVTNIIEGLFPGLLSLLAAIQIFANQIGGIVSIFSGVNQITGIMNQVSGLAGSLGGAIQNPMNLVAAYLPNNIGQGLYALQSPEALINQFLPPQLSESFAKISKITGFGFNGNMGYGLSSVISGFKDGIVQSILAGFTAQFSILSPMLNGGTQIVPPPNTYAPKASTAKTSDGSYSITSTGSTIGKSGNEAQVPKIHTDAPAPTAKAPTSSADTSSLSILGAGGMSQYLSNGSITNQQEAVDYLRKLTLTGVVSTPEVVTTQTPLQKAQAAASARQDTAISVWNSGGSF